MEPHLSSSKTIASRQERDKNPSFENSIRAQHMASKGNVSVALRRYLTATQQKLNFQYTNITKNDGLEEEFPFNYEKYFL